MGWEDKFEEGPEVKREARLSFLYFAGCISLQPAQSGGSDGHDDDGDNDKARGR
jgi:hypothetical protein